jgi:hypothetical protein
MLEHWYYQQHQVNVRKAGKTVLHITAAAALHIGSNTPHPGAQKEGYTTHQLCT